MCKVLCRTVLKFRRERVTNKQTHKLSPLSSLYMYNSNIPVYVTEFFLNDWNNFVEIFHACSSGYKYGLDLQLDSVDVAGTQEEQRLPCPLVLV